MAQKRDREDGDLAMEILERVQKIRKMAIDLFTYLPFSSGPLRVINLATAKFNIASVKKGEFFYPRQLILLDQKLVERGCRPQARLHNIMLNVTAYLCYIIQIDNKDKPGEVARAVLVAFSNFLVFNKLQRGDQDVENSIQRLFSVLYNVSTPPDEEVSDQQIEDEADELMRNNANMIFTSQLRGVFLAHGYERRDQELAVKKRLLFLNACVDLINLMHLLLMQTEDALFIPFELMCLNLIFLGFQTVFYQFRHRQGAGTRIVTTCITQASNLFLVQYLRIFKKGPLDSNYVQGFVGKYIVPSGWIFPVAVVNQLKLELAARNVTSIRTILISSGLNILFLGVVTNEYVNMIQLFEEYQKEIYLYLTNERYRIQNPSEEWTQTLTRYKQDRKTIIFALAADLVKNVVEYHSAQPLFVQSEIPRHYLPVNTVVAGNLARFGLKQLMYPIADKNTMVKTLNEESSKLFELLTSLGVNNLKKDNSTGLPQWPKDKPLQVVYDVVEYETSENSPKMAQKTVTFTPEADLFLKRVLVYCNDMKSYKNALSFQEKYWKIFPKTVLAEKEFEDSKYAEIRDELETFINDLDAILYNLAFFDHWFLSPISFPVELLSSIDEATKQIPGYSKLISFLTESEYVASYRRLNMIYCGRFFRLGAELLNMFEKAKTLFLSPSSTIGERLLNKPLETMQEGVDIFFQNNAIQTLGKFAFAFLAFQAALTRFIRSLSPPQKATNSKPIEKKNVGIVRKVVGNIAETYKPFIQGRVTLAMVAILTYDLYIYNRIKKRGGIFIQDEVEYISIYRLRQWGILSKEDTEKIQLPDREKGNVFRSIINLLNENEVAFYNNQSESNFQLARILR